MLSYFGLLLVLLYSSRSPFDLTMSLRDLNLVYTGQHSPTFLLGAVGQEPLFFRGSEDDTSPTRGGFKYTTLD